MKTIEELRDKVLNGGLLSDEEAYSLISVSDSKALRDAAAAVTAKFVKPVFDSCSIVNARSGLCPENCKWCAQSRHYSTGCDTYTVIDHDECLHAARDNASKGVKRFSLVASGRRVTGKALDEMCALLKEAHEETGISTCASMGLLGREELMKLREAGVRRYHCNLETAPSHFKTLCTTHTIEDKVETIKTARELGFEVCSGGIIGMGESPRQRVEFALKLREVEPTSIPINLLNPIPGTPLENTPLISADEVIDTIAIFRLIYPTVQLRFAGGRSRLTRAEQLEAIRVGINGGIVGDLLTTIGSTIREDRELTSEAGLEF